MSTVTNYKITGPQHFKEGTQFCSQTKRSTFRIRSERNKDPYWLVWVLEIYLANTFGSLMTATHFNKFSGLFWGEMLHSLSTQSVNKCIGQTCTLLLDIFWRWMKIYLLALLGGDGVANLPRHRGTLFLHNCLALLSWHLQFTFLMYFSMWHHCLALFSWHLPFIFWPST